MSRIILDASFVRACPADGSWLRSLVDRGFTLAVVDALAFELCSADDPNQWAAAARKLAAVAEHVECWVHVSEMMRWEQRERRAFSEPADASLTRRFRTYIAAGCSHLRDPTAVCNASAQREVDSGSALCIAIDAFLPLVSRLSGTVRGRSRTEVESACHAFVNNQQNVRVLLDAGGGDAVFAGCDVNHDWVAWHHAKWLLLA